VLSYAAMNPVTARVGKPTTENRTLIVGGQQLFTKALGHILSAEQKLAVIGDAPEMSDDLLKKLQPTLILIDIDGAKVDLGELIDAARALLPAVQICALSMHLESEVMQRALSAGVDGYLVKDVTPNEFTRAIVSIAGGESYVDPRVAGRLLRRRSMASAAEDASELSLREQDVMRLIAGGFSNKEISHKLKLSEKTIKNHVSRIFAKVNCTSRTQAAVYAIRCGLVP